MTEPRLLATCMLLLFSTSVLGQEKPLLRWGGDKNGGAPFIFEDEQGRLVGFEVELAELLAAELGRTPVFVQNQWDNLPELLLRGSDIDIVLNGYEYSEDRDKLTPTTIPYFIYTFRLIGRKDDESITSWENLRNKSPKKKVAVLRGSASESYMEEKFGDSIELIKSEEVTGMLDLVKSGRLDATVQDSPAAGYYITPGRYETLRIVDEPREPGQYVILTRPTDSALRKQLNLALKKLIESGTLLKLYRKYGLWNKDQIALYEAIERVETDEPPAETSPTTRPGFDIIVPKLIAAAGMTILLAILAFPLAILLGVFVALGRVYGPWWLRAILTIHVEVLRGTPLLLQLFVIFYLLPQFGELIGSETIKGLLSLSPVAAAVVGLALNYSASEAENYRAGLLAVPIGQMEAALALGMSRRQALRRIILPQAIRIVIPPVTNDFIALFKDTAVCSSILVVELTGLYYSYKTIPGIALQLALCVGTLYLLMSYPLSLLARRLERRFGTGKERPA